MGPGGLAHFQAATLVAVPGVERMSVCVAHTQMVGHNNKAPFINEPIMQQLSDSFRKKLYPAFDLRLLLFCLLVAFSSY